MLLSCVFRVLPSVIWRESYVGRRLNVLQAQRPAQAVTFGLWVFSPTLSSSARHLLVRLQPKQVFETLLVPRRLLGRLLKLLPQRLCHLVYPMLFEGYWNNAGTEILRTASMSLTWPTRLQRWTQLRIYCSRLNYQIRVMVIKA